MGNFNSGRRTLRKTTLDMHRLDVRKIKRAGLLVVGSSASWQWTTNGNIVHDARLRAHDTHIAINHKCRLIDSEPRTGSYSIEVEHTLCHFGGQRCWWRCPNCHKRAAVLFCSTGSIFACRRCYHLNYACQRESEFDRNMRRIEKIRTRLGWPRGFANGTGIKPHRMQWRTFWKLYEKHKKLEQCLLLYYRQRFVIG